MAAAFSSLPKELIAQIWSHVLEPNDVESFARVSKTIYALGRKSIKEHQILKDRFSILHYKNENKRRHSRPAEFLADILMNPRAGLYVDQIWIEGWKDEWDDPATMVSNEATDFHQPYPEQTMQLFEEAIKTSVFIPESEATEWISEIRQGNETNILALMITLLPNVKTFGVERVAACEHRLSEMVRKIGLSASTKALSRLTEVAVGWSDMTMARNDFDWVKTFSSVKSVKTIQGSLVGQSTTGMEYCFSLPPRWSNVKSLYLDGCNIENKQLSIYLQCVDALETFSYRAARQYTPYEPFWLCTALVAHAGHSLKSLEILSDSGMGWHMGSLAGLNALTDLYTEYMMLLAYIADVDDEKLTEMLPPSIKQVVLQHNDRYNLGVLEGQILRTYKLKADRLPNLKVLTYWINYEKIEGPKPVQTLKEHRHDSEIIAALKQRSIEVDVKLHIDQVAHTIPLRHEK